MIYTISQVQKQFATLLRKVLSEGQIKFKTPDGQVFVIYPLQAVKKSSKSPFEIQSIKLPITTKDILQSIRESRERYS
jgi:hypothetical protein